MKFDVRYANHPDDSRHYDTTELRRHYHISNLFEKDSINLTYSHQDRIIAGGIMPVDEVLVLESFKELAAPYFLARRELGAINVGGDGVMVLDGVEYPVKNRDGYKAIFIGTGVWKPNTLGIKGETFGNVHYAINYLANPDSYKLGERIAVIGAGNAAMDVARTAMRKGAREVTCFSLRRKVSASQYEFSYAQLEGVEFEYNCKPVEIVDEGVIFRDLTEHEDGTVEEIPDSDRLFPADSVIICISQGPQNAIVTTTTGLEASDRGLLVADDCGRTSRPGIFASGDVVKGSRTVVEAVAYSKKVAAAMHEYIQSQLEPEEKI